MNPQAREITLAHKCPDCQAPCDCERGQHNPKDCVHMECVTGIPDAELDRRLKEESKPQATEQEEKENK